MGCIFHKTAYDKFKIDDIPTDLWNIPIKNIDLQDTNLGNYKKDNKAFLFVNVACS